RGRRPRPVGRARRVHLAAGAVRLRRDHHAAHDRGLCRAVGGRDPARRRGPGQGARQQARAGHRVPELRAVPAHDGGRERGVRPGNAARGGQGARRAGGRGAAAGRAGAPGRPPSRPHVGGAAAARGAGPRAGDTAEPVAAGRAAVQPGRQAARRDAAGIAQHPAHGGHHHHPGHARPVRGAGAVRPHRGDESGARRTGGRPVLRLRGAGQRLRRRLPGQGQCVHAAARHRRAGRPGVRRRGCHRPGRSADAARSGHRAARENPVLRAGGLRPAGPHEGPRLPGQPLAVPGRDIGGRGAGDTPERRCAGAGRGTAGAPALAGPRHVPGGWRGAAMNARLNPWLLSAPAVVVYATFLVVPLFLVFLISFFNFEFYGGIEQAFSLANYRDIVTDSYYYEVYARTFGVAVAVTLASLLLGTAEAYVLSRMANPWKGIFLMVVLGPLLISVVVRTLGWALLFGSTGLLSKTLTALGLAS